MNTENAHEKLLRVFNDYYDDNCELIVVNDNYNTLECVLSELNSARIFFKYNYSANIIIEVIFLDNLYSASRFRLDTFTQFMTDIELSR